MSHLKALTARLRGGLSPDCANGLHEPICSGRGCSCDCHF